MIGEGKENGERGKGVTVDVSVSDDAHCDVFLIPQKSVYHNRFVSLMMHQ